MSGSRRRLPVTDGGQHGIPASKSQTQERRAIKASDGIAPVSNGLNETQRKQSDTNERGGKSTKLTDIPSLITVWLQVRVLPRQPTKSVANPSFLVSPHQKRPYS
jgi:hypothetical protein